MKTHSDSGEGPSRSNLEAFPAALEVSEEDFLLKSSAEGAKRAVGFGAGDGWGGLWCVQRGQEAKEPPISFSFYLVTRIWGVVKYNGGVVKYIDFGSQRGG